MLGWVLRVEEEEREKVERQEESQKNESGQLKKERTATSTLRLTTDDDCSSVLLHSSCCLCAGAPHAYCHAKEQLLVPLGRFSIDPAPKQDPPGLVRSWPSSRFLAYSIMLTEGRERESHEFDGPRVLLVLLCKDSKTKQG